MATNSPITHDATPGSGWKIYAELDLPIAAGFESQVQAWMFEAMSTLRVDPALDKRILESALSAISRTASSNDKEHYSPMVRLRVYTPVGVPVGSDMKRNWGFFRIDYHGGPSPQGDRVDHLIKFYLYLDS